MTDYRRKLERRTNIFTLAHDAKAHIPVIFGWNQQIRPSLQRLQQKEREDREDEAGQGPRHFVTLELQKLKQTEKQQSCF